MPPGPIACAIRVPVRGLNDCAHVHTTLLQLLNHRVEVLHFQAEVRAPGGTCGRGLHDLEKCVAADLKIGEAGVPSASRNERLAEPHLFGVEIRRRRIIGDADRDMIQSNDAPAARARIQSPCR